MDKKKIRSILESRPILKSFSYGDFSPEQRKLIEVLGRETFNEFKSGENSEKLKELMSIYNPSLDLKVPNKEYIEKNVTDIDWVLDGPGRDLVYWGPKKRKKLEQVKKELLENEVVLYHEGDEWSLVNLFDNNIKLWIYNINFLINNDPLFVEEVFENTNKIDKDRIINVFFNHESNTEYLTYAQEAFLSNILNNFDDAKELVSGTYGSGIKLEEEFIEFAIQKVGPENVYTFSSKGGVIDMTGVDLCVFLYGRWQPVQVKTIESEAKRNIPEGGFSVYKKDGKFFMKMDTPEKTF
jgi:hypothetical protein